MDLLFDRYECFLFFCASEIFEDADGDVFVKDISIIPVRSADDVMSVMNLGLRLRATHETKMNTVSSRSHCVFQLTVIQRNPTTLESVKGTINLVDLAGSERIKKSVSPISKALISFYYLYRVLYLRKVSGAV